MKRLFVAIPIPNPVKQRLVGLSGGVPGARWQTSEQMHLTVRFIGEVDGAVGADIHSALSVIKAVPFTAELSGVGTFGPKGRERVLWAGVAKSEALGQLRDRIETALVRAGLPPDRRKFHPHVTLARLSGAPKGKLFDFAAAKGSFQSAPFHVDGFALYSSFLSNKGAVYTLEARYPLESVTAQDSID
jgi:2'-5' RNA ligase